MWHNDYVGDIIWIDIKNVVIGSILGSGACAPRVESCVPSSMMFTFRDAQSEWGHIKSVAVCC